VLLGIASSNPAGAWMSVSREYYVFFFQVEVSATGRSLIQTSRTECDVFECNLETLTVKRRRPSRAVEP
jgi:hypothetical protein